MKRNMVWTLFVIAMLSLSLAAMAKDNGNMAGYACSLEKVAGTWGYSETGTITLPSPYGTLPYASVGSYTLDADGNVSGARIASLGGMKLEATITGTATVNPDCTGTITVYFNGGASGMAEKFIVYVDNAREARMIITGGAYPSVLVTEAKKISPGHGNELGD